MWLRCQPMRLWVCGAALLVVLGAQCSPAAGWAVLESHDEPEPHQGANTSNGVQSVDQRNVSYDEKNFIFADPFADNGENIVDQNIDDGQITDGLQNLITRQKHQNARGRNNGQNNLQPINTPAKQTGQHLSIVLPDDPNIENNMLSKSPGQSNKTDDPQNVVPKADKDNNTTAQYSPTQEAVNIVPNTSSRSSSKSYYDDISNRTDAHHNDIQHASAVRFISNSPNNKTPGSTLPLLELPQQAHNSSLGAMWNSSKAIFENSTTFLPAAKGVISLPLVESDVVKISALLGTEDENGKRGKKDGDADILESIQVPIKHMAFLVIRNKILCF